MIIMLFPRIIAIEAQEKGNDLILPTNRPTWKSPGSIYGT